MKDYGSTHTPHNPTRQFTTLSIEIDLHYFYSILTACKIATDRKMHNQMHK